MSRCSYRGPEIDDSAIQPHGGGSAGGTASDLTCGGSRVKPLIEPAYDSARLDIPIVLAAGPSRFVTLPLVRWFQL
jgi:hypothetical protein